jgi:cytochrome c2
MHAPLWVKIGMGLGFSFLGLTVLNMFGTYVYHSNDVEQHASTPDEHGADTTGHGTEPVEDLFDLAGALAAASGDKGSVKKCTACHTFDKGGAQRIGPNLWDIVGRDKAAAEGFSYSGAMKALGGTWSYEDLFAFLSAPKEFAPGSKMTFAGFKKPNQAVDTISYLRTLSDAPLALPEVSSEVVDPVEEAETQGDDAVAEAHDAVEAAAEEASSEVEDTAAEATEEVSVETVDVVEDAAAATEEVVEDAVAVTEEAIEEAAATVEATVEAPVETTVETTVVEAEEAVVEASRFAEASLEGGEKVFKKCKTCHTTEDGGANKIGPNLWNIMGRAKGGVEGFRYSGAMASLGGTWAVEDMDVFLTNPRAAVPGTKMSFAGLKKETDRTNLIAYLASLSGAPMALE